MVSQDSKSIILVKQSKVTTIVIISQRQTDDDDSSPVSPVGDPSGKQLIFRLICLKILGDHLFYQC